MKRVLKYIVLVITVIGFFAVFFGFLNSFAAGFTAAVFYLVVGLVALCPLVAIVVLLHSVENLETRVTYLEDELIRQDVRENPPTERQIPERKTGSFALVDWTCQKCGTVNKKGTSSCEHCGAAH